MVSLTRASSVIIRWRLSCTLKLGVQCLFLRSGSSSHIPDPWSFFFCSTLLSTTVHRAVLFVSI
jgi:hypothetical protein